MTRTGTVAFGEYQTWFRVEGDLASGVPPVVLLHGGPGATHDYLLAMTGLATGGRAVVLYDQLGNGGSTHLRDRAGDGITEHHVLGQSWGGFLAQEHALTRPPGLRSVVLADTAASYAAFLEAANGLRALLPPEVEAVLRAHEQADTTDDPAYAQACQVFYDRHVCRVVPNPPEVQRAFANIDSDPTVYHTMNGPSEFHCIGTATGWSAADRLGQLTTPTLLVSGRHDEATPALQEQLLAAIPDAEWVLFEQSSHMPHVEETERFLAVVRGWLDRH